LRAQPATAHGVLIAVTGYGRDEDRRASKEAGFDVHFVKPVDSGDLPRCWLTLHAAFGIQRQSAV